MNRALYICNLFAAWLALVWEPPSVFAAECAPVEREKGVPGIRIDTVWSGTRVGFAGVAKGDKIYVGYYDAERYLTVAEIDRAAGRLCRIRLPSRYGGWDSHNTIVLAFDSQGRLHVAGNMHASPLVYGRAERPSSLDGLKLSPMIGRDEAHATYPYFLLDPEGRLLFLYRSGGSGNGVWFTNRLDGERWERMEGGPLFTDRGHNEPVNAYFQPFIRDRAGMFHVAVVWRGKPDVSANFAVSYAKSRDLITWFDHDGRAIERPLSPNNMDTVEETGKGAGLLNSAQVFIDPQGRPVVVYTRYGDDGRNVIIAARPNGKQWAKMIVARAKTRHPIVGSGSLGVILRFSNLFFDAAGRRSSIDIRFPSEPNVRQALDFDTLAPIGAPWPIPPGPEAKMAREMPKPAPLEQPSTNLREIRRFGDPPRSGPVGFLYYVTQGVNRDRPRACRPESPRACNPPPSPLIFVEPPLSHQHEQDR